RDFYTRQIDAAEECTALNFGELAIFFKGYAAKIGALLKRFHSNRCHSGRNIYVFQTAFVKRELADAGYAVWNRYARQGFILRERPLTDGSDRLSLYLVRNYDARFASCVPGYRHA